ncbi:MAG: lysophospholipid acyltransferase family protein [Longimicrobiales bacterium]|nr:lysophospholipid acyltransferase family protein [Longimicrobiales bacterium]
MSLRALKHGLEYAAFRLLVAVLRIVPEGLAVRGGALLGLFVATVPRIRRKDVDRHLAQAFPDRDRRWRARVARRSYTHLGREAVVLFRMIRWSEDEIRARTRTEGVDQVHRAVAEGEGVVVLTGHLGNWEVAGAALAARGIPLDVVGKGMANRRFERDLFELRERLGMHVIEMSEAPREVLRSLRDGRATAVVADQNMHRNGIFLPFFERLAATARGPALFALRAGAPVVFGYCLREPGWRQRYMIRVRPLVHEVTGDLEVDIRNLMLAYHAVLEDAVRAAPEQYFWQHRRWKTRPPEEVDPRASEAASGA